MQIVEPSVTLLAYTKLVGDNSESSPEKLIELAMRNCYKSEDKITEDSYRKIIPAVVSLGHTSTVEHVSFTFKIITSRDVLQEFVRHRIASYSVESTRYVSYGKDKKGLQFVKPAWISYDAIYLKEEAIPNSPEKGLREWYFHLKACEDTYNRLLNEGWMPQQARVVLPGCLKTEMVVTMNCRSLLNFLRLRTAKSAHPDIRVVADKIKEIVMGVCPDVFNQLEEVTR